MKHALAIFSLLLLLTNDLTAQAQNVQPTDNVTTLPLPAYKKNEIGLFSEINFSGNYSDGMAGILYKRWAKPNKGFRLAAGVGNYSYLQGRESTQIGDTLILTSRSYIVPMTYVSVGAEMQRTFYKKVVLYAVLDLRGGWGNGYIDSFVDKSLSVQDTSFTGISYYYSRTPGYTRTTIGLLPYIGAKLQFRRFVIGTELRAAEIGYQRQNTPKYGSYGVLNVDLGNFSQRFYVTYRF